jgi:hypothetical protein
MALNTTRGIRRVCMLLTVLWVPLVLSYPFYARRQCRVAVSGELQRFLYMCANDAVGTPERPDTPKITLSECFDVRNQLQEEAFPPELNAYQWVVRRSLGRVELLFDHNNPNREYLVEFLKANLRVPIPEGLPASIVFPMALILPPSLLYCLLICGIALARWLARGFTTLPTSSNLG